MFVGFQFEIFNEPGHIRHIILRIRWRQLKINFFNGRYKKAFFLQALKIRMLNNGSSPGSDLHMHDTLVNPGFNRNSNCYIFRYFRQTGQPISFFDIFPAQPLGQSFRNLSLLYQHSAFAANPFSTTGGIDMNTCFKCRPEKTFARRYIDGSFMGKKFNTTIGHTTFLST